MTVSLSSEGMILLRGDCPLEDAEALVRSLSEDPGAAVDWSGCDRAHTAVIQVLAAARPRLIGSPRSPIVRQHLAAFV
jgi:hypothetical protein